MESAGEGEPASKKPLLVVIPDEEPTEQDYHVTYESNYVGEVTGLPLSDAEVEKAIEEELLQSTGFAPVCSKQDSILTSS